MDLLPLQMTGKLKEIIIYITKPKIFRNGRNPLYDLKFKNKFCFGKSLSNSPISPL